MTDQDDSKRLVLLPLAAWALPLIAVALVAGPVGLDIAHVCHPPGWILTATALGCAVLVPLCLGISIACFALRSRVHNSRFRRYATAGLVVGSVLLVLVVLVFLSWQQAAPFVYTL